MAISGSKSHFDVFHRMGWQIHALRPSCGGLGTYRHAAQISGRILGRVLDLGIGLVKAPYQRRILPFLTSRVFVLHTGDLKSAVFEAKLEKSVHFVLT